MVLRWIQTNIAFFGGDPDLVTIAGHNSGGLSVSLHLISPMSRGLFHTALVSSATHLWHLATKHDQKKIIMKIGRSVGCATDLIPKLIKCLKNTHIDNIINKTVQLYANKSEIFTSQFWKPIVETDFGQERFLTESPLKSYIDGKCAQVPLMAGMTQLEFEYIAYKFRHRASAIDLQQLYSIFDFDEIPMEYMQRSQMITAIKRFYFNDKPIDNDSQINQLRKLIADGSVGLGMHWFVHLVAQAQKHPSAPVYYYNFCYRGVYSNFYSETLSPLGAVHGDDLIYVFSDSTRFPLFKKNDIMTKGVNRMTKLVSNFAKSGNPTAEHRENWIPLTRENENYLDIGCKLVNKQGLRLDRYKFLKTLYNLNF